MEKPWLNEYPPGVPATLDLDPSESVVDIADRAIRRFADRPAFSNLGRTISYREFDALSRRFAAWLQGLPGIVPGDRIAIMLPNLIQYPVALLGAWRAGLVVVNVNPMYTPPELEHQLDNSGARVLVVLAQRAGVFAEIQSRVGVRHVLVTGIGDMLGFLRGPLVNLVMRFVRRMPVAVVPGAIEWSAVEDTDPGSYRPVSLPKGADLACLQYTGGTTGRSRGAMLSHANLVANIRQINTWFSSRVVPGQEIMVTPLPLYHVYALMCNCLCYMDTGGHNLLITDPRNLKRLIAELRSSKFTAITGVNTLYQALVDHADIRTVDFSSLKLTSAGGMAVLPVTARRWKEITGVMIHEGYGLSETSPVVTSNPVTLTEYNGSIGVPLPSTTVSLRDDAGVEVPVGEAGELCVLGPQVMQGYWNDTEATDLAMTSDGFFRTGDIAVMDERGYFRIVDRKKDMIDVSGLKVYPNEIEAAIADHPAVAEAACIGVPDDRTGEAVKVFLVLRPGGELSVEEVQKYLRKSLAPYKIPRQVEFRDTLPKSNVGKILRRELRET
jgi:long-chain acyl-CoA synthetase